VSRNFRTQLDAIATKVAAKTNFCAQFKYQTTHKDRGASAMRDVWMCCKCRVINQDVSRTRCKACGHQRCSPPPKPPETPKP
jgi:hypothetical protein